MTELKNVTRYYLYEVNDTKFHAKVTYRLIKDRYGKMCQYGHGHIQTLDDSFRCAISYGYENKISIDQINYESKCDFNTFFKENHPKKLAIYILGCLQFMVRMSPESEKIEVHDTLNIDLGPEGDGYYRFYNLNNFSYAFYGESYFEKYFKAQGKRWSHKDLNKLNEKPHPFNLIFLGFGSCRIDIEEYIKFLETLVEKYSTTKDFLASFSPENYKGNDFFKDSYIWLTSYVMEVYDKLYKIHIPTRKIWDSKKLIQNVISSDKPLLDSYISDYFYNFNKEASPNNIVIQHDMVYGDCVGTCYDSD